MPDSFKDQLTKYLADVHSIEEQALQQLRSAPKIADDEQLARLFSEHLSETEDQERRVRERLDAIGGQWIGLLEKGLSIAGDDAVATAFADHLEETRSHQAVIEARLDEHEAGPSRIKDAALKVGALNLGAFFTAQPDTPAKLAGFAFAFEHLEVAAYELLRRVAMRAGDDETVRATARILEEEHAAAQT